MLVSHSTIYFLQLNNLTPYADYYRCQHSIVTAFKLSWTGSLLLKQLLYSKERQQLHDLLLRLALASKQVSR